MSLRTLGSQSSAPPSWGQSGRILTRPWTSTHAQGSPSTAGRVQGVLCGHSGGLSCSPDGRQRQTQGPAEPTGSNGSFKVKLLLSNPDRSPRWLVGWASGAASKSAQGRRPELPVTPRDACSDAGPAVSSQASVSQVPPALRDLYLNPDLTGALPALLHRPRSSRAQVASSGDSPTGGPAGWAFHKEGPWENLPGASGALSPGAHICWLCRGMR